jgi:hypothetical protein
MKSNPKNIYTVRLTDWLDVCFNVALSKCYIVVVIFTGNENWGKNADLLYITDI